MAIFKRKTKPVSQPGGLPGGLRHIAFIMDGNGRWAQRRGLPREIGHRKGAENFKVIVRYCGDIGIKTVTIYAFSTENWARPEKEVGAIMELLRKYLDDCEHDAEGKDIHYRFIGNRGRFPAELTEKMDRVERLTRGRPLNLNVAINYGSRDEITNAVNLLLAEGAAVVTPDEITARLYTAQSPDPDLIIRTGGERRLSNFLLWQAAYAELYFTDTLWPDLSKADVDAAVNDFARRKRRFGKI